MSLNVNGKSSLALHRDYAKYIKRADFGGGCFHIELTTGVYLRLFQDDMDWFTAMMDRLITGKPLVRSVCDVPGMPEMPPFPSEEE